VVLGLEIELGPGADLADDLGVLLRVPIGHRRIGEVGQRRQQPLDLGIDRGQLLLELLDLIAQRPRLDRVAAAALALPAQLLDPGKQLSSALVGGQELVDSLGRPPSGQRRLDALGVAADQLQIERRGLLDSLDGCRGSNHL
jgi:hypothetical protein